MRISHDSITRSFFPATNIEIQKPTRNDVLGFIISVCICFVFIALAAWLADVGS